MEEESIDKPAKKRTKRDENREKSQLLILRSSLELFSLKGYGSTTMEMIADRAGISRGLPYLYFESKDKILFTILERHFNREKEMIAELLKLEHKTSMDFVDAILKKISGPFEDGPESDPCLEMRLIMNMMLLPETKSIIQDWVLRFQSEIMESYFQDMKKNFAKFGIEKADEEISYLRMIFFGFTFCRLTMGDEFPTQIMQKRIRSNYLDWVDSKTPGR
ncbi:MAG: TetR/AcrR family transcriptional regulator [Leptospira sp.]|nr:TetR/AcrR family transcriptional regulator [Leptospira sp.]